MDRRTFVTGAAVAAAGLGQGSPSEARPRMHIESRDGTLRVLDGTEPVLVYHQTPVSGSAGTGPLFTRGAYIHPLHAPCGAVVTDDFPADHLHQRGLFFAWTKTQIGSGADEVHPDFWNLGSGTGRIRAVKSEGSTREGETQQFRAEHVWEACRGEKWEPVLDETWEVVVHAPRFADRNAPDAAYLIDLTSRQTPRVALELPAYRYGGISVRGARGWIPPDSGMKVLTSEGKDHATADRTKARWVDVSGPVEGKTCGVALLEHPSNVRAPNPLRVPPEYPYYVFVPEQVEGLTLAAGKLYTFRYRLVVHNGAADPVVLESLWKQFAGG